MEEQIQAYIEGQPKESTQKILNRLHQLLHHELDLEARIRYKIPFYYNRSWICYLNATKEGGVELAFTRGNELSNAQGLLQSQGRQQVSGVIFRDPGEIHEDVLLEVINEALLLDETVPYTSKRKKKG
jgi:hypothetical protein